MKKKIYVRGFGNFPYSFSEEKIEQIFESVMGGSCQEQDLAIIETCRDFVIENYDSVPLPEDKRGNAYLLMERMEKIREINKSIDKVRDHILETNSNTCLVIHMN
jgi:hypothetical protein